MAKHHHIAVSKHLCAIALLLASCTPDFVKAFQHHYTSRSSRHFTFEKLSPLFVSTAGKGFAPTTGDSNPTSPKEQPITISSPDEGEGEVDQLKAMAMNMDVPELKTRLIELIPRMKGSPDEFRRVEAYVNALEDKFTPPQTLGFLNLAMAGDWQFLFTTNQLGMPSPQLRLTGLVQRVEPQQHDGLIKNMVSWDLANDEVTFDARGTFTSTISYKINQGARMTTNTDLDLAINLAKGSTVPSDQQGLVGLIYRSMPKELFDSSDLAMDTTYLDTELRIVRWTGSRHEGVRNIFIRSGSVQINPSLK